MTRRARLVAAALLFAAVPASGQQPPPAFEPQVESPEVLPEGNGREETFYSCTACHGTALIRRQQLSREGWNAIIADMVANRGMAEPDEADRRLILDYLAAAFPIQARPQGGWRSPFAPQ